jgi:hypothetical protein
MEGGRADPRHRAPDLHQQWRPGLWRHARRCRADRGDPRSQGARPQGGALSLRADGHTRGQWPAKSDRRYRPAGLSLARADDGKHRTGTARHSGWNCDHAKRNQCAVRWNACLGCRRRGRQRRLAWGRRGLPALHPAPCRVGHRRGRCRRLRDRLGDDRPDPAEGRNRRVSVRRTARASRGRYQGDAGRCDNADLCRRLDRICRLPAR